MPRTLQYLKHGLGAAVFNRHTIAGENSLPNIVGVLTGECPPCRGRANRL
jgi:hypothetical protein